MSKVIYSEIYLVFEDQPDGDVWGINQVGLKNRISSKPFCKQIKRTETGWIRKHSCQLSDMSVLVGCSRRSEDGLCIPSGHFSTGVLQAVRWGAPHSTGA